MYVSIFCQHFRLTQASKSPMKNPGKTATGNVRIDSMKLVTKDVVNYHFNGILFGISFNRVERTKFCHWMYHVVWSITITFK